MNNYTISQKKESPLILVLFLIFCISQGSVTTRLKVQWEYNNSFAAKFLLSPAVKEFLKSVNLSQSYV